MFNPKSITLSTDKIILRPLEMADAEAFQQAGAFDEVWRWAIPNQCTSIATTKAWLSYSKMMVDKGEQVTFAIIDKKSGQFVGSTRYCSIVTEDRNIEIGFTFITPTFQRSYINTHAKYCLLKHAFEDLNAIRVQFKTHEKNDKSRQAIGRLGAKFEGITRNQRILSDGSYRNTAMFSIISSEWLTIKQNLKDRMAKHYG